MFDADRLFGRLLNSGFAGGLAGGAVSGTVVSALSSKGGRKLAGNALKLGGLALAGGLAYTAWNRYRQRQSGQAVAQPDAVAALEAPSEDGRFLPQASDGEGRDRLGRLLIQAMIGAAKADGRIDAGEQQRIMDHVTGLELDPEEKAFVWDTMSQPANIEKIVGAVRTPEEAAEVYAASLLAIDPDGAAERGYLGMLAARLQLDAGLVDELHKGVAAARTG